MKLADKAEISVSKVGYITDKLKLKQDDRENLNDCEQQNYNRLARTYSC